MRRYNGPARLAALIVPGVTARRPTGKIHLTFDDGPHPETTPRILEALAAQACPATFFVVGQRAEQHPETVRAVLKGGHGLGIHGWTHHALMWRGYAQTAGEIRRAAETLESLTGRFPRWFRPPYGLFDLSVLRAASELRLRVVLWSVAAGDWKPLEPGELVRRVCRATKKGDIIVLHDAGRGATQVARALPDLIAALRARGLEFAALDD